MTQVFVEGIGLVGPGLSGWAASRPALAGSQHYAAAPTAVAYEWRKGLDRAKLSRN